YHIPVGRTVRRPAAWPVTRADPTPHDTRARRHRSARHRAGHRFPTPVIVTNPSTPFARASSVALPFAEAEALIASLPGVSSARSVETDGGGVGDIHVLTGAEVPAKQTVRNVESALLAHFGIRVDHRKISVATTTEGARTRAGRPTPMIA